MSSKRCDAEKKIAFQDAALIGQGQMCKWMWISSDSLP